MDTDEVERAVAQAMRRAGEAEERSLKASSAVLEAMQVLVRILKANGALNEGHQRLLDKVCQDAQPQRSKVRLRVYVDKYQVASSLVDCEKRIPICKGRCCSLTVEMSRQDLDERKLLWDIDQPYVLRRERDGRCTHQDRKTHFCGAYEYRPADCRTYDCRNDDRIWLDFEKMIPAPWPEGVT